MLFSVSKSIGSRRLNLRELFVARAKFCHVTVIISRDNSAILYWNPDMLSAVFTTCRIYQAPHLPHAVFIPCAGFTVTMSHIHAHRDHELYNCECVHV